MPTADALVIETTTRMLDELCPAEVVSAAEDGQWPAALWAALEEAGLALAWVPEARGGAGAGLADGFAIARVAGAAAAPVPLAETLLAGWLLADAGLDVPAGTLAVAPVRPGDGFALDDRGRLRGQARRVPFARNAGHLAVVAAGPDGPFVALVDAATAAVVGGESLAGEPLDVVELDAAPVVASAPSTLADPGAGVRAMGAALRAQQIAGALERILEQSLRYAGERSQFGRPIAKFQAVQHSLAMLAGESAAAGAAADAAAAAIERHGIDDPRTFAAVAAAKIRAGEAAGAGAAIAHQVHGAMGFTREYSLQQATRRLWSWRDDFGPETEWAIALGRRAAERGADELWASLTEI